MKANVFVVHLPSDEYSPAERRYAFAGVKRDGTSTYRDVTYAQHVRQAVEAVLPNLTLEPPHDNGRINFRAVDKHGHPVIRPESCDYLLYLNGQRWGPVRIIAEIEIPGSYSLDKLLGTRVI